MEFLLCADLIPAQRAYEMGVLNALVSREQLLDTAYEFARRMTANAPLAVQATKRSALQGLYHDEDTTRALRDAVKSLSGVLQQAGTGDPGETKAAIDAAVSVLDGLAGELRTPFEKESRLSSQIFQTEDAKEGPKAFAEKRPPRWQAK
jgi:enoyl-CoA hydratase